MPNVTVSRSPVHGVGCFATVGVDAGGVIGRIEGECTDENGEHVIWTEEDRGLLVTNDLRYLNHAREPNAEVDPNTLEVVALRPIAAGEEVTIDYGDDWA